MNSHKPIGGYFQLELRKGKFAYDDSILLNSGRNCIEYILRANNFKHIYIPKYTCDVILEPLKKLNIPYTFYSINDHLEISQKPVLKEDEVIIYTNYFGLKNEYSNKLIDEYKYQLILDCSQAFYFDRKKECHQFYSPRKFFGVSDGGCLYTSKKLGQMLATDISYKRTSHLLKRIDLGAEKAYRDFKTNDDCIVNQPIKHMSALTQTILESIDFDAVEKKRNSNFQFLHKNLKQMNLFNIIPSNVTGPMCYPLISSNINLRNNLIKNKIFVAQYWPNVLEWCNKEEVEYELTTSLLPLPIDQRYDDADMERVLEVIKSA